MELTGLPVMAAAVAALVALSIFSVAACTLTNALLEKIGSRRKTVRTLGPDSDGHLVLKVTYPKVYRGFWPSLLEGILLTLPRGMLFGYILTTAIFLYLPLMMIYYDGLILPDANGKLIVQFLSDDYVHTPLPEDNNWPSWKDAMITLFSVYCCIVVIVILSVKAFIDNRLNPLPPSEYLISGRAN